MSKAKLYLAFFVIITLVYGVILINIHQLLRQGGDDPQIQIAEDGAVKLTEGKKAEDIVLPKEVDINKSLAVFTIIFNRDKKPVLSSAVSEGRIPTPPEGVFDYALEHGVNKVTWQTKSGARIASVVIPFQGSNPGYILAGRSLREVEKRQNQFIKQVVVAWIITIFIMAGTIYGSKNKAK